MKYTPRRKLKDERIVRFIEKRGVDIYTIDKHLEDKILFLTKGMQYKNLRVGSNKSGFTWQPIEACSSQRITSVVRKTYQESKSRLEKYAEPQLDLFS